MSLVKCEFTSIWDDGSVVTTLCEYNPETGEVTPEVSNNEPPSGALLREYITLSDGEEIEVCKTCHEFTLQPVVGDLADLSYGEYGECRNPDCCDEDLDYFDFDENEENNED